MKNRTFVAPRRMEPDRPLTDAAPSATANGNGRGSAPSPACLVQKSRIPFLLAEPWNGFLRTGEKDIDVRLNKFPFSEVKAGQILEFDHGVGGVKPNFALLTDDWMIHN